MQSLNSSAVFPLFLIIIGGLLMIQAPKWAKSALISRHKLNVGKEWINMSGINCPVKLVKIWRNDAKNLPSLNPNVDNFVLSFMKESDNTPFAITSQLRELCEDGFKFTPGYNYESEKHHPNVSALFIWAFKKSDGSIGTRQVRFDGIAEKLSEAESQNLFKSESVLFKIRTTAQSQLMGKRVTDNGVEIDSKVNKLVQEYEKNVKAFNPIKPDTWNAYIFKLKTVEFIQESGNSVGYKIRFRRVEKTPQIFLQDGLKASGKSWVYEQIAHI